MSSRVCPRPPPGSSCDGLKMLISIRNGPCRSSPPVARAGPDLQRRSGQTVLRAAVENLWQLPGQDDRSAGRRRCRTPTRTTPHRPRGPPALRVGKWPVVSYVHGQAVVATNGGCSKFAQPFSGHQHHAGGRRASHQSLRDRLRGTGHWHGTITTMRFHRIELQGFGKGRGHNRSSVSQGLISTAVTRQPLIPEVGRQSHRGTVMTPVDCSRAKLKRSSRPAPTTDRAPPNPPHAITGPAQPSLTAQPGVRRRTQTKGPKDRIPCQPLTWDRIRSKLLPMELVVGSCGGSFYRG